VHVTTLRLLAATKTGKLQISTATRELDMCLSLYESLQPNHNVAVKKI
jgi:hypothetical protein